jgi:hypothetical protein
MGKLLATGECEEALRARIDADFASTSGRNGLRKRVNTQAEIPRGATACLSCADQGAQAWLIVPGGKRAA